VRILELPAGKSPREWGHIHGESFRGEIKAFAAIRTYLSTTAGRGQFKTTADVLAAAERHLPVLERWHRPLHEELLGIAEGAGLTAAQIVVANHYTDLRDLGPDASTWTAADAEGGCSVVFARTPHGALLAQTWDMHATAIPYVMMLRIPESADGPGAWCLTLTGCLGLAGMNATHTAIAINNLNSTDARIGVVWPALVRRALHQRNAHEARDLVVTAPVGSGHHYFVADKKDAFGIETSGRMRKMVFASYDRAAPKSYLHTNHCLDAEVAAATRVPAGSTTHQRLAWLERSVEAAAVVGMEDVWARLGSQDGWPASVCTNMATPEDPHGSATCGALAMNLDTGELWAQGGFVTNVAPEKFHV
jgi:isopenicillin-N N-acyltransferase-like protein